MTQKHYNGPVTDKFLDYFMVVATIVAVVAIIVGVFF